MELSYIDDHKGVDRALIELGRGSLCCDDDGVSNGGDIESDDELRWHHGECEYTDEFGRDRHRVSDNGRDEFGRVSDHGQVTTWWNTIVSNELEFRYGSDREEWTCSKDGRSFAVDHVTRWAVHDRVFCVECGCGQPCSSFR